MLDSIWSVQIEALVMQMVPDVTGDGNEYMPLHVWHGDAESLAHLTHHIEAEAFQEGIADVPLLQIKMVFYRERHQEPL